MSITGKDGKETIGLAKYMDQDLFPRKNFYDTISLKEVEKMQNKMESKIMDLRNYNPRIQERKDLKIIILDNGQKLFEGRDMIIEALKKHVF